MPFGNFSRSLAWAVRTAWVKQRYFRRNEGTTDYATIPAVTLAGDFMFSVDILRSGTNTGGQFAFTTRNSASGSYGLSLYSSGDWANGTGALSLFGFSSAPTITGLSADKLYSIKVVYTASTGVLEMYSNNVVEFTGISSPPSGLATADTMAIAGAPQGGFRLQGIVANLKIWDNGTLIRDYPLDEPKGTDIIVNRATELGEESVSTSSSYGNAGGSLSVMDSTATVVDQGTWGYVFKDYTLQQDTNYLISVHVTGAYSGFELVVWDRNDNVFTKLDNTLIIDGVATLAVSSVSGITRVGVSRATAVNGDGITIQSISVRQANGYGTIINGNDEDKGLFTKQANGEWLGQELSNKTEARLPAEYVSGPYYYWNVNQSAAGVTYRITCNLVGPISLGGDSAGWSAQTGIPVTQAFRSIDGSSGVYGGDYTASTSDNQRLYYSDSTGETEFDNISVKEVLKSA